MTDSLKKRYIFKVVANLLNVAINLVTQSVIPRGLGPKNYGDFNFLTGFFNEFVSFLDTGTSTAFYTKLSQRQKESSLVVFYFYFIAVVSLGLLFFVMISKATSVHYMLWPGQQLVYVYMATGVAILTWLVMILGQITDAYGLTVSAETVRISQKFVGLLMILVLVVFYQLKLMHFFYYQYFLAFFLIVLFLWVVREKVYLLKMNWRLSRKQITDYTREFYRYVSPLFVYSLVGLLVGILDRWLLQVFGGSIQQGFYSLSFQIGAACFLFAGSMSPLFMRELSIEYANKDFSAMARLFRRYIPALYSIVAYFSCFVAVQAEKVIYIFGGNTYADALTPVTIMAFYPLNQTYGQLSGSVFYATGQTSLYRNIGITSMLIGLPVSYFLLASKGHWGLDMGATGLAVKRVLMTFLGVNAQLYFNARYLKLKFWRYLGHQIIIIVCFTVIALLVKLFVDRIAIPEHHIIPRFLAAGFLYTVLIAGFAYCVPAIFGLKRGDISLLIETAFKKIRKD